MPRRTARSRHQKIDARHAETFSRSPEDAMMKPRANGLLLTIMLLGMATTSCAQHAPDKTSPFEMIRWVDDTPQVLVESTWYEPVAIEGVPVTDILDFCATRWPGLMKKRFGEDLPEALQLMDRRLPVGVDLDLIRLSDRASITLEDVEMSKSNRRAILQANRNAALGTGANDDSRSQLPRFITKEQALSDITEFERRLDERFAYRTWRNIDLDSELDAVRSALEKRVDVNEFAQALNAVLAKFGDGHARVAAGSGARPSFYPPFLVEYAGDGFIAVRPDRSGFLDPDRPYIVAIDGIAIEDWLETVRPQVVDGSPQLIRARSIRLLRELEEIRELRGLPRSESVLCSLASTPSGDDTVEESVAMTRSRPVYGSWPRVPPDGMQGRSSISGILPGNIGYIRIEAMDSRLVPEFRRSMDQLRDTDGLVIDVRGNGGGARTLLIALAGYLKAPDDSPWVGNVAQYRLCDEFDRDHLDARFMYRRNDRRWTDEQRVVIDEFARDFQPEWQPGSGFSEWHYLVLDNTDDDAEYHYDKPVVILSDPNCFSATDIFLGGLSGRPGITVLGKASGGGSARSQGFRLRRSGAEVRCASMASFRPDGRLYDGRGIEVDVEVDPEPEFFINGGRDAQLDAAVKMILIPPADPSDTALD